MVRVRKRRPVPGPVWRLVSVAAGLACLAASLAVGTADESVECVKTATFFAAPDSPDYRKYAPDRDVLVTHLALDLTPDFKQRTVQGRATLQLQANARAVREVRLDAVDLRVQSVEATHPVEAFHLTDNALILTFTRDLPPGGRATLTVAYEAEPKKGLYFRTPEMGYQPGDTHLFTQGEEMEARHWYPCLDFPNQFFTSEVICRVPEGMTVVSNGRLVSQAPDANGRVAFHWRQEKPHVSYLVTLVAGYFKKLEDRHGAIPLAFYTPPSEFEQAANSFRGTREMMAFFEEEIGVPYPWAKYDQVVVNDFVAGGMENTSATTLTDRTLFTEATENIRNSEGLVAHELAHQWFGNLVTCKDWSQIWLNEGFATYYESLWTAFRQGRAAMLYELYHRARQLTDRSTETTPMVRRTFSDPGEMFNHLAYDKGSWVLHMLRAQLGEELFRRGIRAYLERHAHGNVVTDDLRRVFEEVSGKTLDPFFDQWVYHGGLPSLDVSWSWDQQRRLARLTVKQTQPVDDQVLLFSFPLPVRFQGRFGVVEQTVQIKSRQEDFYFSLESAPEMVRLDPDYALLARIRFPVSRAMLEAQLKDSGDVIGRLLAVEELGRHRDKDAIAKLKETLAADEFYGVRIEAARALRGIHSEEALSALLACRNQPDARVRRQVVEELGRFYHPRALEAAREIVRAERNPAIRAEALKALGAYGQPEVRNTLLEFLNSESYRNELAEAALEGIRANDDPFFIGLLLEILARREGDFTTRGLAQGIETLAWVARNEPQKDNVREFILRHVNSPKPRLQLASLKALGTLGDWKARPVLERFASAAEDSPERRAAESALRILRAERKPADEFRSLRQEVLELQKANREMNQALESLRKQVQAISARASKPGRHPPATIRSPKESEP